MKELIRLRGCNEEFIADPALLQEGKVLSLSVLLFCPELEHHGHKTGNFDASTIMPVKLHNRSAEDWTQRLILPPFAEAISHPG